MPRAGAAQPIVVLGAGGFGREVADVVHAVNEAAAEPLWELLGYVDDGSPDEQLLARRDERLVGTSADLPRLAPAAFVVAVGDPRVRRRLAELAVAAGLRPAVLVHPSATFGRDSGRPSIRR